MPNFRKVTLRFGILGGPDGRQRLKIATIKAIRAITNCSLSTSKKLYEDNVSIDEGVLYLDVVMSKEQLADFIDQFYANKRFFNCKSVGDLPGDCPSLEIERVGPLQEGLIWADPDHKLKRSFV